LAREYGSDNAAESGIYDRIRALTYPHGILVPKLSHRRKLRQSAASVYTAKPEDFLSARAEDVTELLNQWANVDQGAGEKVFPLVYRELRRIASRSMNRQGASHTLQTTRWSMKPTSA
jgi:hypothetical protein